MRLLPAKDIFHPKKKKKKKSLPKAVGILLHVCSYQYVLGFEMSHPSDNVVGSFI